MIRSLPRNKSAGPDCVSAVHLAFAPSVLSNALAHLFNAVMHTGICVLSLIDAYT